MMAKLLAFFTGVPVRTYVIALVTALVLTACTSTIQWHRTTVSTAKQFVRDSIATAAILVATVQDTFGTALPLTFKNLTVTLAAFRRQVAV